MHRLGWTQADIILISGDTYIDSPYIGVALIGRVLMAAGFKTAVIAQPGINSTTDINRLGNPRLFWGVSGGSVDSMVANYTALKKRRKSDDFTPGGRNTRRPDRAVIVYTNLIRKLQKETDHKSPIVLGGIEASLRRISHYDFWSNKVRRSILFDARADILLYGMAERTVVQLARTLTEKGDFRTLPGLCYIGTQVPDGFTELPPHKTVMMDKSAASRMFEEFYHNNDPLTAHGLAQLQDSRYLIQNPPAPYLKTEELDKIHALPFSREVHPYYKRHGTVRALTTIQAAITTHRGCYGECNFCAIAVHQGRTVRSRSEESILKEAVEISKQPFFKGNILDVGGPTANMYGFECARKLSKGPCRHRRCLTPEICPNLKINHKRQLALLKKLRSLPGIKRVFIASGIRYDMVMTGGQGREYLREVVKHHVSGQLKIAPEHCLDHVLTQMGKPQVKHLLEFKHLFDEESRKAGKPQFLTYYFIAAHPGCTLKDMRDLKDFCRRHLRIAPEQTQIFTPTPSTYSTLMYWTGRDLEGHKIYCERDSKKKEAQKVALINKINKKRIHKVMQTS